MSKASPKIVRVTVIPHPDADAIELAQVGGYVSVVRKGEFKTGDLAVYIPEDFVVPNNILSRLGLEGRLAGSGKNRVKAIRLRGILSQGIVGSFAALGISGEEGEEVGDHLGIIKYEPPIPVAMAGEVFNAGRELTLDFDVQNWKSYPDILREGEYVIFTEKLHGTCTIIAVLPYKDAHPEAFGEKRNILIMSKGLGAKGLALKNNERNQSNLYVRATRALVARIDEMQRDAADTVIVPHFILGETFGPGVQDLTYGKEIGFRAFASAYGYRGDQHYLNWDFVDGWLKAQINFETVPILYRGPFSEAVMRKYTDGKTTMCADHIREGIVMIPAMERTDQRIGRVCLKSVSAEYLTRKGGTEFN